jgi:hypothetical protein
MRIAKPRPGAVSRGSGVKKNWPNQEKDMSKQLYRKFVVTASDYAGEPHKRAEGYRFEQVLKFGIAMCLTARGKDEVQRMDAQGQPIVVQVREAFVDEQGHEYDEDGEVTLNPEAHSFTLQTRGYIAVREDEQLRAPQMFVPTLRKPDEIKFGQSRWKLRATDAKEIAKGVEQSARELNRQSRELDARANALKVAHQQREEASAAALKAAQEKAAQKATEAEAAQLEAAKHADENKTLRDQIAALTKTKTPVPPAK